MPKPGRASAYAGGQIEHVRATCLYIATKLGDLIEDIVVVGGLAPSLLIEQERLEPDERHVGTLDLDVGLALALLDDERYQALTERLRNAGFAEDENHKGKPTSQRWMIDGPPKVTVDFLIPPSRPDDKPGRLRNLEKGFAAIVAPGLALAFRDRERVRLRGSTIVGESAARDVWVAGPGAYVVLKALAFRNRGENKDAYDLYYLLRFYESGVEAVAARLRPLLDDLDAKSALEMLREDFAEIDDVGPRRVAEFLHGSVDEGLQADAQGLVLELVRQCTTPDTV